jgi:raffinose/stachyose/melibiose transport system permease protein
VVFTAIIVVPSVAGIAYSFTSWSGLGEAVDFIGIANYVELFQTPAALGALGHTLLIAVVVTVVQNLIGLLLALALNSRIKSRIVLRTILFAPVVMTPIIVGYMWKYLYSPDGPISTGLTTLFGASDAEINFLGDPKIAIWSVIAVIIWQHSGYSMAIFLAGLQRVPDELREAAALDGAGAFRTFWSITRPFLRVALVINLTLSIVTSLKVFDQVMALTQGGPNNATQTISSLLYNEAFLFSKFGFGMSLGVALFVLVVVVAYSQLRVGREREELR